METLHPSDAVALSAGLLSLLGYSLHDRGRLLQVTCVSTMLWALYYYLRGADTSAALVLVSVVRIALSTQSLSWQQWHRLAVTQVLLSCSGAIVSFTWAGAVSIPALFATAVLTVATLNLRLVPMRYAFLLADATWFCNGIITHALWSSAAATVGILVSVRALRIELKQVNDREGA
jgi:hypothetical protein